MGFELDRFNGDVDPDFKCNLCNKVLEDPLTTPCGHVFCAGCVLPWVVQQGSCPVNCQRISTKELNHVLPLKSLILKLDIKCDNHARGCEAVLPLQHLGEHAETCDFSPAKCRNRGCRQVLNLRDVEAHMRERCEARAPRPCKCACCIVSSSTFYQIYGYSWPSRLCSFSAVLQKAVIQFSEAVPNLKKAGRCHVTTDLWSSGQSITCLSQHFGQLSNTNSFSLPRSQRSTIRKLASLCTGEFFKRPMGEETKALTLVLHRDSGSLGFNIIGGRPCVDNQDGSSSEGIFVSKIVDTGPAAKEGGLQIHDRIIEV
ncbi:E3 ubiquitin-protein ligase PDZRN3, partial [Nipponia nippon]